MVTDPAAAERLASTRRLVEAGVIRAEDASKLHGSYARSVLSKVLTLPASEWAFTPTAGGAECTVRPDQEPAEVLLWQAAADSRDFRKARWTSVPLHAADGAWRAEIPRPASGFNAALVECRYPRVPLPLMLTTSVSMQASA